MNAGIERWLTLMPDMLYAQPPPNGRHVAAAVMDDSFTIHCLERIRHTPPRL
jgi:hypothetical protein